MTGGFDASILKKPRWIVAIVVGVLISLAFVRLGMWQLDRLEERRAFNATVEARTAEPTRPLEGVLGQYEGDVDEMKHRQARVEGVYRIEDEFFSVGRLVDGMSGTLIATPLDRDDGTVLIVIRGLVPPGTSGPPAQGYEPPEGRVVIEGRLDDGEAPSAIGEPDPVNGDLTSLSRLDLEYIDKWVDGDVLPITLMLENQDPRDPEGVPVRIPSEELTEGSHLGYAVQWFAFALFVLVGVAAMVYRAGTAESVSETEMDRTSQP